MATLVSSTSAANPYSGTVAVPYMGSIASGDLLVTLLGGFGAYSSFSSPSGWTTVEDSATTDRWFAIAFRIADGTESGSVTFTAGIDEMAGAMHRITGHGVSVVGDFISAVVGFQETPISPALTGVTAGSLVIIGTYTKPGPDANPGLPSGFTAAETVSGDDNYIRLDTAYQVPMSGSIGSFSWPTVASTSSSASIAIPTAAAGGASKPLTGPIGA